MHLGRRINICACANAVYQAADMLYTVPYASSHTSQINGVLYWRDGELECDVSDIGKCYLAVFLALKIAEDLPERQPLCLL